MCPYQKLYDLRSISPFRSLETKMNWNKLILDSDWLPSWKMLHADKTTPYYKVPLFLSLATFSFQTLFHVEFMRNAICQNRAFICLYICFLGRTPKLRKKGAYKLDGLSGEVWSWRWILSQDINCQSFVLIIFGRDRI